MHQLRRYVLITIEKRTPAQKTDLHRLHPRLQDPRDYSIVSEATVFLLRIHLPETWISKWETPHAPFQNAGVKKHRLSNRTQDPMFSTSDHHRRHSPQSRPVGQSRQAVFRVLLLQHPHGDGAKSSQTKKTRCRSHSHPQRTYYHPRKRRLEKHGLNHDSNQGVLPLCPHDVLRILNRDQPRVQVDD